MSKQNFIQGKVKYLVIFLIGFLVYSNTFNNGFVLDDDVVYLQNQYVQEGVSGIPDIFTHGFLYGFNQRSDQSYRPFVLMGFAIDHSIFGNNARALHVLNVILFGLLCCLILYFLKQLFSNYSPWLPFWISLLFALHPIHTEVVANIKGRDELLHAITLIASFIYFFKYLDEKAKKHLWYSCLLFFLALLSKEMAVTYIALLPLTIWSFRSLKIKEIAMHLIPFLGVLLVYFALRSLVLDTVTFEDKMNVINNSLAATNGFSERIATNFLIFGTYIKLLFFPHPLAWDYSFPFFTPVGFGNPLVILTVVVFITLLVLSLLGLKSKNKYAFSFLFFITSFSVVSNFFILIGSTLGERFLFFPSLAFSIFCGYLIWNLSQKFVKNSKSAQTLTTILVLLIALPYAAKTVDRNKDWESNFTLFQAGVEATPDNSRATSALASAYRTMAENSGPTQEAKFNYSKAVEGYLKSVELYPENTDSWYNLGVVYMNTNEAEKAKNAFITTIRQDPNHISARNNLGVIYFNQQDLQNAALQFRNCLKINPDFQSAYANLGAIFHNMGDYKKARKYYKVAIQINPNDQTSRSNLSKLPSSGE